jgi:hypothetical protein
MKTKIFLSAMAFAGVISILSSCSKETVAPEAVTPIELKSGVIPAPASILAGTDVTPIPVCTITGTVTEDETAGLLFMREEEKLARDVYSYLYLKYKLPVFNNISKSENVHMTAVLNLINGFKIADNSNNNPGEFTNQELKDLFVVLKAKGDVSVTEALKVGVDIELKDIKDLKDELALLQNASIKTVYTNLSKGSEAHLKAFTLNLKVRGVVYP